MRTIRTITSESEEQERYYEEDESLVDTQECYYSEAESISEVDRMTQAVWAGTLAMEEQLEGHIVRSDFKSVFKGVLPGSGQRIRGKRPNAEDKERLAHDVVMSAPKSVSMAMNLEGDLGIFDDHMSAVKETLALLEQQLGQTRIQVNGVRQVVNTGKLLAALIPHHTSRDGDMQLHTHMLLMNGTIGPDGVWRSLSHEALAQAEWVGGFYRQRLAEKLQARGYRIYNTEHGFELVGYSRDDIEVFSKRNRAIVKAVKEDGLTVNAQNKKDKVLTTRKAKSKSGQKLEEIQELWGKEARSSQVGKPVREQPIIVQPDHKTAVYEVNSAIRHLSERSVSFSRKDIYEYAFKRIHAEGLSFKHVDQAINEHKSLLKAGEGRFTTVEALEQEIEIVQQWMKGQGKATPLLSHPDLEGSELKSGQAEAVWRTLTSNDTHQIIHGLSGVGKTKALGELVRQLRGSGMDVQGFAPTIDAAAGLQEELGIKTNTVEHLVLSKPDPSLNQLWMIDESGMISARQMQAIERKAEAVGARLILVGDKGQNSSVEAGSPLRSLIKNGATVHSIGQIIRQQNPIQKQAVELIANGNGSAALKLLEENGYVKQEANREERVQAIADQYLGLSPSEQKETLIVTGTNAERLAINNLIREQLKHKGILGASVKTVQLVSRQFTDEQARRTDNYIVGDYIRLRRDYQSTSLQKDQLYKVEKLKGDELIVSSYGGRIYRFNPSQYKDKEVYRVQEMEIAVGDQLRWTTSDKSKGQINGHKFTVTALEGTTMSVVDQKGKTYDVSLLQPLAVDYDLVSTSYRAQGKTKKRVIVSATSDPTSSREPFYVKISRQFKELTVYTQDLKQLREWVKRSNAQQNPVELIGKHYVNRNDRTHPTNRNDERATATNRTTESRNFEPERNVAPTDLRDDQHDPILSQGSSEPVHHSADRTVAEPPAQRDDRDSQQTRYGNGSSLRQDQRQQHSLSSDEQLRERLSRTDPQLQEAVIVKRIVGITRRISEAQAELTAEFKGVDELAVAIADYQAENQLVESLKSANVYLERLDQVLVQATQAEMVETLFDAITQWRSGQELATAIATFDSATRQGVSPEASSQEHKRIEAALLQVQSLDILDADLKQLASVIGEWQDEQELTRAITRVTDVINGLAQVQSSNQMPQLAELVQSLNDEQLLVDSGFGEKLTELTQQLNTINLEQRDYQFEGLADLAYIINDLSQAEALGESELGEKLRSIELCIEQLNATLSLDQFKGMNELARAIADHQTETALAESLKQLEDVLNQFAHRQEIAQLADSGLDAKLSQLANQIDKFQFRTTPYEFEGMKELVEIVAERRAEDMIAQHMAGFNDATEQVNLLVQHYPRLEQLAQAVRSFQATEENLPPETKKPLQELSERLRRIGINSTPTPKKIEGFWSPGATTEPPSHIDPNHWREWVEDSCVHPAIAQARLQTVYGHAVYDRLLSEKLATLGSGQYVTLPMARLMQGYEQLASDGGWWVGSGVGPRSFPTLKPGETPSLSLYGTFKPNNPRIGEDGKIRKYENPRGVKKELFDRDLNFSAVPDEIAEQIYRQHGITPTVEEKASGFWYVVYKYPEIPIYRTEGNKKDAAITSQGRVVISGQGVNAGYRAKDQFGDKLRQRVLHPQLEVFAQPGREIRFAFDQDSKLSTVLNVRQELVREAELLSERGCNIYSLQWDHRSGKGADDLIKNKGPVAFERADSLAVPIEQIMKQHYRTKYNSIAKRVVQELGNISQERVDLEVYIRAIINGDIKDGARFVGESDVVRALRQQKPETAEHYIRAISSVAGTYKRLLKRDVQELEQLTIKLVEQQLAAIELESEKLIALENCHRPKPQKGARF